MPHYNSLRDLRAKFMQKTMSEQSNKPEVPAAPAPQGRNAPRQGDGGGRKPQGQGKPQQQGARLPREPGERTPREVVRNPLPPITFPEDLPVSGRRGDIAKALTENQVIIVSGETGSGKTTQLPKICLQLGRGQKGLIGHTQPRRIAASSTAKRIAQELGSPLGEHVGFKVRFNDTLSKGASVKLMTDGILLAETQTDPLLKAYDTIIIDEAHERSLNIDFLLGYLKQLLPRRPDLKVIITSATIDADRFSRHFGQPGKPAPVIEVSGRLYKVEVRYRPVDRDPAAPAAVEGKPQPKAQAARDKRDLMDGVIDAVDELSHIGSGDVLVFLPGEREIRDCAEAGLTIDAGFNRVAKELGKAYPELGDEFGLTAIELGFLNERRNAFENLTARVDLEAVRGVVTTMIQTEKYGTPLASALRVLSAEFRNDRMMRAEEKAARLPAIMTIPLILFILPTLFVVILGPAACSIADSSLGGN